MATNNGDDDASFVVDNTRRSRWQNKRIATQEADDEMAEFYRKRQKDYQNGSEDTLSPTLSIENTAQNRNDLTQLDFPLLESVRKKHPNVSVQESICEAENLDTLNDSKIEMNLEKLLNVELDDIDKDMLSCLSSPSVRSSASEELSGEVHKTVYLPLLSIAFYLGNRLTKQALSNHLKILKIACNFDLRELSSVHCLLSQYTHLKTKIQKVWVCGHSKCHSILTTQIKDKKPVEKPTSKQPCGHNYNEYQNKDCYILHLPIEKQLIYFIEHHGLPSSDVPQSEDFDHRGDVVTGSVYTDLRRKGVISSNTITLQLNMDGANCFKVSEYGIWPFMGVINEVSYKLRRNFMILFSLWFGNKKPPRKAFMDTPLLELKKLQKEGFLVNGERYYVVVLIVSTDTVARTIPWNVGQFNGKFGCNFCLMEGIRVSKGKGNVRVYPEPRKGCPIAELRSLHQHQRDIKLVLDTGKSVNGIKGETPLSILPGFDYVKACVSEYMHGSCLGTIKYFLKLYFTGAKSQGPWFIGTKRKIAVVNARLNKIKPPYEITRTGGLIDDLPNWKASMFRSFGLYYFVVLEDILPVKFFDHFCLLAYGLNTLLQEKVSVENVKKTEIIFRQFVKDTEILYGVQHVTINIHFLTHLSQCVLDWGCLWAYSTFIPEWFNGELLNLKHGSQAVAEQMAQNYLLKMAIRDKVVNLEKEGQNLPPDVSNILRELLHLPSSSLSYDDGLEVQDSRFLLLPPTERKILNINEEIAFMNYLRTVPVFFDNSVVQYYSRIRIKSTGKIFTTTTYNRSPKRVNYCCVLQNQKFVFIESIICIDSSEVYLIGKELGTESKTLYVPKNIEAVEFSYISGQTVKLVGLSESLVAFRPLDIFNKCVISFQNDITKMFVVTSLVNNFETD